MRTTLWIGQFGVQPGLGDHVDRLTELRDDDVLGGIHLIEDQEDGQQGEGDQAKAEGANESHGGVSCEAWGMFRSIVRHDARQTGVSSMRSAPYGGGGNV